MSLPSPGRLALICFAVGTVFSLLSLLWVPFVVVAVAFWLAGLVDLLAWVRTPD